MRRRDQRIARALEITTTLDLLAITLTASGKLFHVGIALLVYNMFEYRNYFVLAMGHLNYFRYIDSFPYIGFYIVEAISKCVSQQLLKSQLKFLGDSSSSKQKIKQSHVFCNI